MELRPEDLAPRDRYKLLIGCIVPRPIAFVSTISLDGKLNLAPFSFFMRRRKMDSIFISKGKRRLLVGFCVHRPKTFWGLPRGDRHNRWGRYAPLPQ